VKGIIPNGTRVTINSLGHSQHKGWGTIAHFDGELYHVRMYGRTPGTRDIMVFDRKELRVPKVKVIKGH